MVFFHEIKTKMKALDRITTRDVEIEGRLVKEGSIVSAFLYRDVVSLTLDFRIDFCNTVF